MSIIGRAIRTLASVVIKTVTGAFVSFSDAKAGEAFKAVVADINASGGATGVTVARTGKNLCNLGTQTFERARLFQLCSGAVFPAGTYRFSAQVSSNDTSGTTCLVALCKGSTVVQGGKYIVRDTGRKSISFTPSSEFDSVYLYAATSYSAAAGDTATYTNIQLEKSSSLTSYAAFNGDVYSVSWSSVAGSVSSGEINLTTGVLTSGGNTYQLTPTAITAKSGVNNMWADTGDITVEYTSE